MAGFAFSMKPKNVQLVSSKYRKIQTKIPVPESIKIFEDLERYESRSMHGQLPVVWDRAEDFQVFDKWGNQWIDFTSTIFVTNAGHANPLLLSELKKMIDQKLLHTYTFASEIRRDFLKKLIEVTPEFCEKAFLLSAGTEATECSVKLMRLYGQTKKASKVGIISFHGSMHGRTMLAEMLKGTEKTSRWIGYKDPHIHHLPFPYPWPAPEKDTDGFYWRDRFREDINDLEDGGVDLNKLCGFIIEPYLGWGAIFFPKVYVQELADFARENDVLITFDEIQGGFGRTGKLFAYQHYEVEPDMLCIGKAVSGSLPLSAVIGRKEIMDLPEIGSMSSTHSANPLSCATGLANLNAIESFNLIEESKRKGKILHYHLKNMKNKYHDRISHIFGHGLLAGIIIKNPDTNEGDPLFASMVCEKCMEKGLLVVHTGRESIKIGPPLTIPDDALIEGINVLDESFQEVINGDGEK